MDVILTGASRGIGRALALALPPAVRIHALARDAEALASLARRRPNTIPLSVDLSSLDAASGVGSTLASLRGVTLIHNAGLWPARLELAGGYERAFVVNCLAPLALQRPLLAAGSVARILVVGAGLMIKGRFDAERTPTGADFSMLRTYASTKLAGAIAMRDVASAHPEVDVAVVHPGVVRTDLGRRDGFLGWLLERVKSRWEPVEPCAERLAKLLERPRWSPPGTARWFVLDEEKPWPDVTASEAPAVRAALQGAFAQRKPPSANR